MFINKFDYLDYIKKQERLKKAYDSCKSKLLSKIRSFRCPICSDLKLHLSESTSHGHGESYYTWWVECANCFYRTVGHGSYAGYEEIEVLSQLIDILKSHIDFRCNIDE